MPSCAVARARPPPVARAPARARARGVLNVPAII